MLPPTRGPDPGDRQAAGLLPLRPQPGLRGLCRSRGGPLHRRVQALRRQGDPVPGLGGGRLEPGAILGQEVARPREGQDRRDAGHLREQERVLRVRMVERGQDVPAVGRSVPELRGDGFPLRALDRRLGLRCLGITADLPVLRDRAHTRLRRALGTRPLLRHQGRLAEALRGCRRLRWHEGDGYREHIQGQRGRADRGAPLHLPASQVLAARSARDIGPLQRADRRRHRQGDQGRPRLLVCGVRGLGARTCGLGLRWPNHALPTEPAACA